MLYLHPLRTHPTWSIKILFRKSTSLSNTQQRPCCQASGTSLFEVWRQSLRDFMRCPLNLLCFFFEGRIGGERSRSVEAGFVVWGRSGCSDCAGTRNPSVLPAQVPSGICRKQAPGKATGQHHGGRTRREGRSRSTSIPIRTFPHPSMFDWHPEKSTIKPGWCGNHLKVPMQLLGLIPQWRLLDKSRLDLVSSQSLNISRSIMFQFLSKYDAFSKEIFWLNIH